MSPGGEATFGVRYTQFGYDAVEQSFNRLTGQLRTVRREQRSTARGATELGRSFRNIALRTFTILGIVRTFRAVTGAIHDSIATGIEYNQVIEQSRLAIASLITAQADLVDSNGRVLEGVEALDAAYSLATDQVRKLRVAGIQTAATTKELVDAFQQAVGAGLATGLTLDEIRVVTIRIAQAAGALGVPYRQLNEEIRSILGGIIDQNTRIAKALQITNDQVRLAKEQGRLAEFLVERFEAFGIAGERIVETWGALKSNVAETLELLAGEMTFPAFEAIRTRGLIAVQRIFDFDTAEISKDFAEIIRQMQHVFAGIGDQTASVIERAVDRASDLNQWLLDNEEVTTRTADEFGEIVSGLGEMIRGVASVGIGLTKWGIELGYIAQMAQTTADLFKEIGRNPIWSTVAFGGVGVGLFAAVNAIFGTTALVAAAAATALGITVATFDALNKSAAEAADEIARYDQRQTQAILATQGQADQALKLAEAYAKLNIALKANQVEEGNVEDVRNRMEGILRQLNQLSPEYRNAIEDLTGAEEEYTEAIKEVIRQKRAQILLDLAANQVAQASARQRLATLEQERQEAMGAGHFQWSTRFIQFMNDFLIPGRTGRRQEIEALRIELETLMADSEAIQEFVALLDKVLAAGAVTVKGGAPDDSAERLKAARAAIELELATIEAAFKKNKAVLEEQLDTHAISQDEYYAKLIALQRWVFNERIRLSNELAVVEEDDAQREARARAKAIQLEADKLVTIADIEKQRREYARRTATERIELEADTLEAIGRSADAMRMKLLDQYKETILEARNLGEEGMRQIGAILRNIRIQVAEEALGELEEALQRAQQRLRDRQRGIELSVELGTITPEEGQAQLADAYEDFAHLLKTLIPLAEEFATQIGSPKALATVQELHQLLFQVEGEIEKLNDKWREFRLQVAQAAQQEIARYLSDAIIKAENLGEAFENTIGSLEGIRNLLGQIAKQIVEITARIIAMKIVQASFKALNLAIPELGFARGGSVSGPGTSTSDSVLARLSTGEYVVRAASVKKYGADFFHALNAGAFPRQVANLRGYATGGVVGAAVPAATTKDFRGELTIGLQEGLVLDQMNTPDGERLMLKVISKNRRGVLTALGIR